MRQLPPAAAVVAAAAAAVAAAATAVPSAPSAAGAAAAVAGAATTATTLVLLVASGERGRQDAKAWFLSLFRMDVTQILIPLVPPATRDFEAERAFSTGYIWIAF